jgi:pteridine reductase
MEHPTKTPRAVLITGAAKRIGKVIAIDLAKRGYFIAIHYHRSRREAESTAKIIRKQGGDCGLFQCDFSQDHELIRLIKRVKKEYPGLACLINNASLFKPESKRLGSPAALFDRHFQINLRAPYILTAEFARRCGRGVIINILDRDIVKNRISHLSYLLSKKSLADFTQLAAIELAPNIRVNAIAPGAVLPPAGKSHSYLNKLALNIPLRHLPTTQDIVRSIEFFLNNENITGQTIFVDGGEHLV